MKFELLKDQLLFKNDYLWNNFHEDDPRVSGPLTNTPFTPSEGYEVLYLINELISIWRFDGERYAIKLEKMIRCGLSCEAMHQKEVKAWIKTHWMNY